MTQILLIGAAGQVGQELQTVLPNVGEVVALDRHALDLTQPDQIRQCIRQFQPNYIVNAAAYTAVDRAENEAELANQINAIAPTVMAQEAQALNALLLHLSTDYVFDGYSYRPYRVEDPPQPLSVYGQSKLAGEMGIRQVGDRHVILRTAWVYGVYGKSNFVKTMLRLGSTQEELRIVADQVGSPTWAADIAHALGQLIVCDRANIRADKRSVIQGTYHFTNSGVASWYDFTVAILEEAEALGLPVQTKSILPVTTADYPTPARRPAYSVLDHRQLWPILGGPPRHWRHSLRSMLQQYSLLTATSATPSDS
ncbi:dTDP-4-dehydrorhamnose reductase [Alkalinema pantanalense CENA528]|uniref:dTDP-4-dehydrorhamnose reductase n=1 Tax=Alkalinema pantanalense TaxID=1620705 RepID=UPI003D6F85E0